MGAVVNLRQARKQARREHDARQAAENRLRYGRSKADRQLEAARTAKAARSLDQLRVKSGDER